MRKVQYIVPACIAGLLLLSSYLALGTDALAFLKWYLMVFIFGLCGMSVARLFFSRFEDKGWLFSKVLGIVLCGYLCWLFPALHVFAFTKPYTIVITVICLVGLVLCGRFGENPFSDVPWKTVVFEEFLFFSLMLLWAYLAGCKPELCGVEKFMDYGFMASIDRADYFPPVDMWYGGEDLNYYYGGQYFAVYLSRMAFVPISKGYHLMRAFIAAMAFMLPFSICRQMLNIISNKYIPTIGGILSGIAVSFCGNMHYVVYGILRPLLGINSEKAYFFPDSTRFIGYVPDVPDKTIHEFPAYSFILGDLHAHVADVVFVLLFLGLVYTWMADRDISGRYLKYPIACGCLLGIFQWVNMWDWLIYLVVGCGACLFMTVATHRKISFFLSGCGLMFVLGFAIASPFLLRFDGGSSALGVALCEKHSALWQLLLLWGFPVFLYLLFFIYKRVDYLMDLYALLLSICAVGLVLIPELVYVRDIYEGDYSRCNTMFKLTYQAFILFGISMGYVIVLLFHGYTHWIIKCGGAMGLVLLLATSGYFFTGISQWCGVSYDTLDGISYMDERYPEDVGAIRWMMEHIDGQPVVLELDGESYSDCCRVSAMTGIPTVLGWHTHEWLWRGDYDAMMSVSEDVYSVYSCHDLEQIRDILDSYRVEYLFIGSVERENCPDMDEDILRSLGDTVYDDGMAVVIQCSGNL